MRIGKKGLNPTIPLCHYCGKPKNMIMLTGLAGEKWATKNGHSDGEMPMHVYVEDDVEPCDECKKKGIALIEIVPGEPPKPTGCLWLVTENMIDRMLDADSDLYKFAKEHRYMYIDQQAVDAIGLTRGNIN